MHSNGKGQHAKPNGNNNASRSSGKQLSEEENRIIERVKREGFSGNLLLHEVGRRLGQFFQQRDRNRNGNDVRAPESSPHTSARLGHLAEASGDLARRVLKSFPMHVQSVPPVDFESNSGGDPRHLPYVQTYRSIVTIPAGTTTAFQLRPNGNGPGFYVNFSTATIASTIFDKTAGATWPFDGTTNIPLQALYSLRNPPNIRGAFGVFNDMNWPVSDSNLLGSSDANCEKYLLSGGVAFEVHVPYGGTAAVSYLSPSDHEVSYGPKMPEDLSAMRNLLTRNEATFADGSRISLNTALPATGLDSMQEQLPHSIIRYMPTGALDSSDNFSYANIRAICKQELQVGGSNGAVKTYAWTFHTEQESAFYEGLLDSGAVYAAPTQVSIGANPTAFIASGQGFMMVSATTTDVSVVITSRCHFAGALYGSAVAQHANRPEVELFNNDERADCDTHADSPSAHPSVVASTLEEALAGAGVATLASQLKNTAIAKTIGNKITQLPIAGQVGKTLVHKVESGAGWLVSHLGSLAKSILPKVATVGEGLAEAAVFL